MPVGKTTAIQWTDHTMNFWWGCRKVSPGCDHCYAETLSHRLGKDFTTPWLTSAANWDNVRKWDYAAMVAGKPAYIFVNSMSDFFDGRVPPEWRERAWSEMRKATHLIFQVLTKRPGLMAHWAVTHPWPDHIWAGTSVESARYLPRLDVLIRVPAKVRFVSCEPLLEPLDLAPWILGKVSWVIAGGESGPRARPTDLAWIRDIVGQCREARIPVFVKQMGSRPVADAGYPGSIRRVSDGLLILRHSKGGDPAEWPVDLCVRKMPL